jgi:predicted butyrate kinase (DUF1464 family)
MLVHVYNPSTWEADRRIVSLRPAWASQWDPDSVKRKKQVIKLNEWPNYVKKQKVLAGNTDKILTVVILNKNGGLGDFAW